MGFSGSGFAVAGTLGQASALAWRPSCCLGVGSWDSGPGFGLARRPSCPKWFSVLWLAGLGDGGGLRTSARPRGWQAGLPDLGTASGRPRGWQASDALPDLGTAWVFDPRSAPRLASARHAACWTWGRQGSPDLRPAPRLASRLAGLGDGVGLRTFARPRGWQASHALLDLGTAWVSRPSPGPEAGKAHTLCWTWGRRGSPDLRPAPRLARLVLILKLTCSRHFTTFTFRVQVQGLPYLNPCPSLPPSLPLPTATGC